MFESGTNLFFWIIFEVNERKYKILSFLATWEMKYFLWAFSPSQNSKHTIFFHFSIWFCTLWKANNLIFLAEFSTSYYHGKAGYYSLSTNSGWGGDREYQKNPFCGLRRPLTPYLTMSILIIFLPNTKIIYSAWY